MTADQRAPLVGRVSELRFVADAYAELSAANNPKARLVTIFGAAGVGKSRLVREFVRSVENARTFRGSARSSDGTYGVFARLLRARFGIVEGMSEDIQKEQVRAEVSKVLEDRKVGDVCYFLGQLLGLSFFDSPIIRALEADPAQAIFTRRAVLQRFLEADARGGGGDGDGLLVLVFEDLHAAHKDALELLQHLARSVEARVLFICLGRTELRAHFEGSVAPQLRAPRASLPPTDRNDSIELTPMTEQESVTFMEHLLAPCGSDPNTGELIEGAVNLAGGNPALLEQMVRVFHDMGVLQTEDPFAESEVWTVHLERLDEVKLPMNVEDAVGARIAALSPEERRVLERAATMGSVFWLGGLVTLTRSESEAPEFWNAGESAEGAKLRQVLEELTERDYILHLPDSTFQGDEEYVFKHNLEREALLRTVAGSLTKSYHATLADWLSFKAPVKGNEEYLSMLGHHYERADAHVHAGLAYLDAADAARSHYANAKASELYEQGLALLASLPEVSVEKLLSTYHHYGDVLQLLGRMEEAEVCFRKMLALAHRLDLLGKGGASHGRIGRLFRDMGRLEEAHAHLDAALSLFEASEDLRGVASTTDDIGKLHWLRGDYERALAFTQKALQMRRRIGERRSIALSLNNLGLVYQDSGQFLQALETFEQALRIRREITDLVGVSITLNNLGTVSQDQGDDVKALTLFKEALEVAKETGDKTRIALVLTNLGETYNRLRDPEKAIIYLRDARALTEELGDKLGLAEAIRGISKAYLNKRDLVKSREAIFRAVELFREVGSKVQLGVALRTQGEVLSQGTEGAKDAQAARDVLRQSIEIFEQIGNFIELGRSCTSLAALLEQNAEFKGEASSREEAKIVRGRAEDVAKRLRASQVAALRPSP
jgi:tetratricopeptide (TPR) repeat protein